MTIDNNDFDFDDNDFIMTLIMIDRRLIVHCPLNTIIEKPYHNNALHFTSVYCR